MSRRLLVFGLSPDPFPAVWPKLRSAEAAARQECDIGATSGTRLRPDPAPSPKLVERIDDNGLMSGGDVSGAEGTEPPATAVG